jgi:hypothetical protein
MFLRVLSAMLAADAIDRHMRAQERRSRDAQERTAAPSLARMAPGTQAGTRRPIGRFDPRAPERP